MALNVFKIIIHVTISWLFKIIKLFVFSYQQDFVKRPGLLGDMAEFSQSQKAELVVLMTLHISADNKPMRELSVYSKSAIYRRQVRTTHDRTW